jgi:tungstate transport system substrate-binding protein
MGAAGPGWALVVLIGLVPLAHARAATPAVRELRLLIDPEIHRSGLLDRLLPPFEEGRGIQVSVRGLPSREALEVGASGGADVVWVHAPRLAVQYLNQGFYLDRRGVLYTDYVLAGPASDPARVRETRRIVQAFRRIARARAPFASGGKRAASYLLEQDLWEKARVSPSGPWYSREDADPARLLALAAARGAYVLADRASLEPVLAAGQLRIFLAGVEPLRREYHVMEVNPHRLSRVNYLDAKALGDYLLSPAAQEMIGRFRLEPDGASVFFPMAGRRESDWRPAGPGEPRRRATVSTKGDGS